MPIVNTLAFLFTVLGEWYVEGKVISKGQSAHLDTRSRRADRTIDTGAGMALSLVGIALCVHSKT